MYYESDFATVEWDDNAKVAKLTWKKFAQGRDFQEPSLKALELAKQKGATNWFSDTTSLGALKDEDTNWFIKEVVGGMLQAGIKQQALIIPASVISKMSLNKASDQADDMGLTTKYFSDVNEALAWLKG